MLRGILAVGLKFGLDGAMYVTDWITGWDSKNRGRIWKLDTPATASSAERKEVQTLLGETSRSRPVGGRGDAARARRHARSSEGAVRAGAPERQRDPHRGGQGPRKSARARSCDLGPGAAGAQEPVRGRIAPALPDRRRRRDPRPGGEDARRHALRRGGAGVDDDGRRRGGEAAVLRDGSARPPGPQAGAPRASSRCSPTTTTRTSTCATPAASRWRALATCRRSRRCRRISRRASGSRRSTRCAGCAAPSSRSSWPTATN